MVGVEALVVVVVVVVSKGDSRSGNGTGTEGSNEVSRQSISSVTASAWKAQHQERVAQCSAAHVGSRQLRQSRQTRQSLGAGVPKSTAAAAATARLCLLSLPSQQPTGEVPSCELCVVRRASRVARGAWCVSGRFGRSGKEPREL